MKIVDTNKSTEFDCTTKESISKWLDQHEIKNYRINDDLTVDVDGDVILESLDLFEIPTQFGNVHGNFSVYSNKNLETLKGCPYYVRGYFDCSCCNLSSLEFLPLEFKQLFCYKNSITHIYKWQIPPMCHLISCSDNPLEFLEIPETVDTLYCDLWPDDVIDRNILNQFNFAQKTKKFLNL